VGLGGNERRTVFAGIKAAYDPKTLVIATIVWATGFRPDYSWLHVPVLDRNGRLRHDGGVVAAPGLYTLGLNFMRRRRSSYLHGAEDDTSDLCAHLVRYLRARAPALRATAWR
jgi:putative flavoprotein involved in K+ transport